VVTLYLKYVILDFLGTDLVRDIFSGCLSFLSSSYREVVRAALALIRVAVGILPVQELHPHAETLVSPPSCWAGQGGALPTCRLMVFL